MKTIKCSLIYYSPKYINDTKNAYIWEKKKNFIYKTTIFQNKTQMVNLWTSLYGI